MSERKDVHTDEKSTDELRAEIAETRARVAEDVQALGNKLSPESLKQQAKFAVTQGVRERATAMKYGIRNARTSVVDSARSNPIPVALIGLGLGWLIWDARRRSHAPASSFEADYDYGVGYGPDYGVTGAEYGGYGTAPYGTATYGGQYNAGQYGQFTEDTGGEHSRLADVRDKAQGVADQARSKVQGWAGDASDGMHRAKDRAAMMSRSARDRAAHMQMRARQRAMWARQQARQRFEGNPLAVGAVALAAGVGVGLMLPATEREDRWMGEKRDEFLGRVKERAHEVGEVASETARRAAEAAKQTAKETARSEAERRGLTSEALQQGGSQAQSSDEDVSVHEVKSVGESWQRSPLQTGPNGRSV